MSEAWRSPSDRPSDPAIYPLRFDRVSAYLIVDDRPILVDTGLPDDQQHLAEQLILHRISPEDLSLIVVTHAHFDHTGSLKALHALKTPPIPIAAHPRAAACLSQGRGAPFGENLRIGRMLRPLITRFPPMPAITVDLTISEPCPLEAYGVRGRLLPTPGHTQGCLTVLLENGDTVVGDLLRPNMFFRKGRRVPWVINDLGTWKQSLTQLLRLGARRFYGGHGGPFSRAQVEELLRWVG